MLEVPAPYGLPIPPTFSSPSLKQFYCIIDPNNFWVKASKIKNKIYPGICVFNCGFTYPLLVGGVSVNQIHLILVTQSKYTHNLFYNFILFSSKPCNGV